MKRVALYNPYLETRGGGEKVCLALAETLQRDLDCQVSLVTFSEVDLELLANYFKLDLTGVTVTRVNFETIPMKMLNKLPVPGRIKNIITDNKVGRTVKRGNFDIFINNCYQSNMPSACKKGVYMCMFPQKLDGYSADMTLAKRIYVWLARKLNRVVLHPLHRSPIDTYQTITANSAYTQSYITKLWKKDSDILFPICENMKSSSVAYKKPVILSVGRFFANTGESHHKRHDFLLETFAKMKDLHEAGWELHFAGSVAEDVGALKYILQLMHDSQGLPVFFHFNTSFDELKSLYNQASVYWHATGYGSDPLKHPEKQEHFGITTVEAMSAGCIPIVINSAGQKESVISGENGFLWDTQQELIDYTMQVSKFKSADFSRLSKHAEESASRFDNSAFHKNVHEIFSKLIA